MCAKWCAYLRDMHHFAQLLCAKWYYHLEHLEHHLEHHLEQSNNQLNLRKKYYDLRTN